MYLPKQKLPRGIRNNNPLNIRKGNNWQGERHPQTDPAFEEFESIEMGLRAAFILLRNYITGYGGKRRPCNTIEKIVSRWAPEVENATRNYIQFVSDYTHVYERETIEFSNRARMVDIVRAMAFVENGMWIDTNVIQSAYDLV